MDNVCMDGSNSSYCGYCLQYGTSEWRRKDYKIYDVNNNILGSMKGEELYLRYFDSVKDQMNKKKIQRTGKEKKI